MKDSTVRRFEELEHRLATVEHVLAEQHRTCPRCSSYVEALPPRRICDECETEIGTRPVPYVGMLISGENARRDLPDGTEVVHDPSGTRRTIGDPTTWGGPLARGVHAQFLYRVDYLPGGDECAPGQRDRTAAVDGAAVTLAWHAKSVTRSGCICGWERDGITHARHVAEQLAAVGALGDHEPVTERAVLIDKDGDEWWPTVGGCYVLLRKGEDDIEYRPEIEDRYGPVIERFES